MQKAYEIEIKNRFEILDNENNTEDTKEGGVQKEYNKLVHVISEVNNKILPKNKRSNTKWESQKTQELIETKNIQKIKWINNRNTENLNNLSKTKEELTKSIKSDKEKYYNKICNDITKANNTNNTRELYKYVKILSNVHKNKNNILEQNNIEKWRNYFDKLLNVQKEDEYIEIEPALTDLPIKTEKFNINEIIGAIKTLKNNKFFSWHRYDHKRKS